ncbi:hypothetical protein LI90_4333 (plasmid) [Carbonactinospora thermoautotrophica]|uniref:Uncharacterized protein n=1 Tax=Carbonactinospora thermoautotrophica TaxID=1469144 RepID=A0A132MIV8_9ACTN|nr:hypothetical protein [Carbonactinospora thermoautotrophica]KWW97361.1 hypothetical protein LI90_4333 [Carbonactinospora thermoautotrophica]
MAKTKQPEIGGWIRPAELRTRDIVETGHGRVLFEVEDCWPTTAGAEGLTHLPPQTVIYIVTGWRYDEASKTEKPVRGLHLPTSEFILRGRPDA